MRMKHLSQEDISEGERNFLLAAVRGNVKSYSPPSFNARNSSPFNAVLKRELSNEVVDKQLMKMGDILDLSFEEEKQEDILSLLQKERKLQSHQK